LRYGDYSISDDDLDNFRFEWARPRALNSQNLTELIGTSEQWADFLVKIYEGDNSVNDPRVKDRLYTWFIKNKLMNGVLDWESFDAEIKEVLLNVRSELKTEEASKVQTGEEGQ
jgi:hypothetical protein